MGKLSQEELKKLVSTHEIVGIPDRTPPLHEKIPTISPEVERVVLTALAKDPLQRFTTIQVFANAFYSSIVAIRRNCEQYAGRMMVPASFQEAETRQPRYGIPIAGKPF